MSNTLIDSIGIEIEFANIQKSHSATLENITWRTVEDGSCRSRRGIVPGLPIEVEGGNESALFGGEFVSPIIDTSTNKKWKDTVRRILDWLAESGEGLAATTSIHVHVNAAGIPMFALQNLLKLGLFLEAGMFRLSCAEMGVHRGALHLDYGYCRPLGREGPPVVRCVDEELRPVFDTSKLVKMKTLTHLRQGLGRFDQHSGSKYHEARYVWLNLISLYQLGSIEFRLFNSTFGYRNVLAWVDLCQNIVRASFLPTVELQENPLGTTNIQLEDMVEVVGLRENKTIYTLEELWNTAGYQRGVMGHQMGHLGHSVNWRRAPQYLVPSVLPRDEVRDFNEFSLGRAPQPIVEGWYNIGR